MRRGAALLALSLGGTSAAGQSMPARDSVGTFLTTVRAATERYRDRAAAIADGYRQIGPDFPTMGEHWVSIPLVVRGEVDPLHPPILEYVTMAGEPVLAGVAYTQLVLDGMPRAVVPAPLSAWHYHAGTVDEESFMLSHAHRSAAADSATRPRIAVLHAWLWLENPAGLFAADNWALPWHRLGMTPPSETDSLTPAGLAAAMASDGGGYFLALLRSQPGLPADCGDQVAAVFDYHARELRKRIQVAAAQGQTPSQLEFVHAWSVVEAKLRAVCPGRTMLAPASHR